MKQDQETSLQTSLDFNLLIFKRNANAFSLNAIVDVRLRRHLHHHEMNFWEYLGSYKS